jgi:hypothetical protein
MKKFFKEVCRAQDMGVNKGWCDGEGRGRLLALGSHTLVP